MPSRCNSLEGKLPYNDIGKEWTYIGAANGSAWNTISTAYNLDSFDEIMLVYKNTSGITLGGITYDIKSTRSTGIDQLPLCCFYDATYYGICILMPNLVKVWTAHFTHILYVYGR